MNTNLLSYEEYKLIAKKVLKKHCEKWLFIKLSKEPNMGDAVSEVMMADYKFDGRGSIEGYRKLRLDWWISYKTTQYKEEIKTKQLSTNLIDTTIDFENVDLGIDIKDLLSKLNPDEQALIYSRFFDKQTYDEIAQKLNITLEGARQQIKKTIKKLQKLYKKERIHHVV